MDKLDRRGAVGGGVAAELHALVALVFGGCALLLLVEGEGFEPGFLAGEELGHVDDNHVLAEGDAEGTLFGAALHEKLDLDLVALALDHGLVAVPRVVLRRLEPVHQDSLDNGTSTFKIDESNLSFPFREERALSAALRDFQA